MSTIFVTVGSAYPFDRLIRACDQLAGADPAQNWIAQIHEGTFEPEHMRFERYMDKPDFDAAMADADLLVGHAGMGTIHDALALDKPLLVLARRKEFGEHVNDHQVAGAELFGSGGHVLVAETAEDLGDRLVDLADFVPVHREVHATELADEIGAFLERL